MKNLLSTSILVLLFCFVSFAQINQIAPCPTISVIGPAGIVMPGETMSLTAGAIEEVEKLDLKYVWTIVDGEIFEGQGTSRIEIKTPEIQYKIIATVKILNLPKNCLNDSASFTMFAVMCPGLILIDEFSTSSSQIDKAKLGNLAKESQNDPNAQIYIIERFKKNTSSKTIELKNQKTINHLKAQGVERNTITLLNAFDNENLTSFMLVPLGVTPPDCDGCIEF